MKSISNITEFKHSHFFGKCYQGVKVFSAVKKIRYLFFLVMALLPINLNAQVNRNDAKNSIPYRANYQRMVTSSSARHTLEIRKTSESNLWGWGYNGFKQLNKYRKIEYYAPVEQQDQGTSLGKWVDIATGGRHSLGIRADGSLWAWGENTLGQLGIGNDDKQVGVIRVGTDNDWVAVAAGYFHSVALKANGTLWAWGLNVDGQVGTGFIAQEQNVPGMLPRPIILYHFNKPIQIGTETFWSSIAAGDYFTMALKPNTVGTWSSIYEWGRNDDGQLGTGNNDMKTVPTKIDGTDKDWVSISAGGNFALAVKANGNLYSWGANDEGQLGLGSNEAKDKKNKQTQVGGDNKWVRAKAGGKHVLALKSNGTIWAWGCNDYHQSVRRDSLVACGDTVNIKSVPRQVGKRNHWVAIEAGESHSLALSANGGLYAWGHNSRGQLGIGKKAINPMGGDSINTQNPILINRPITSKWLKVSISGTHILALKSNGRIYEDKNGFGFVKVSEDSTWVSVVAGKNHSLALKSDGSLWTWGDNQYGQLGDGTKVDSFSPKQIGIMKIVPEVKPTEPPKEGTLVGIPTDPVAPKSPVPSSAIYDWISIGAGNFSSYALRSDGTLWSWGFNKNGQLGDKTANTDRLFPVQMWSAKSVFDNTPELYDKWVSISGGGNSALALKADGTYWGCGDNNNGKLSSIENDGTYKDKWFLRKLGDTGHNWVSLSSGINHTVGLKNFGTILTWGDNEQNQLGHPAQTFSSDQKQVGTDVNWIAVAAGDYSTFGIKANGTLWGWGWNGEHQLGVDTPTPIHSGNANFNSSIGSANPIQIGTDNDWINVVSGATETLGLRADGDMYRWGNATLIPTLVPN